MTENKLLKKLENGGTVVVAEGYIFEFERRGYLQAGTFVPEVVLEHPELVRLLYEEMIHAGSDVVLAFTYYAHRKKLNLINRDDDVERMNRAALQMAREVADKYGCLLAGNICNTTAYFPDDKSSYITVDNIFKEQIELAIEYDVDFIVGETFSHFGEAMLSLEAIKKYGKGVPAVITVSPPASDTLADGVTLVDCCKRLEAAGAAVVGLNCGRGPETIMAPIRNIKKACKVPVAALPVTYRTTAEEPTFFSMKIPGTNELAFPLNLPACLSSRNQIEKFARECKDLGIQYVGLCCGNSAHFQRIVAEIYGKNPASSRYAPKMEKHFIFGEKEINHSAYTETVKNIMIGK